MLDECAVWPDLPPALDLMLPSASCDLIKDLWCGFCLLFFWYNFLFMHLASSGTKHHMPTPVYRYVHSFLLGWSRYFGIRLWSQKNQQAINCLQDLWSITVMECVTIHRNRSKSYQLLFSTSASLVIFQLIPPSLWNGFPPFDKHWVCDSISGVTKLAVSSFDLGFLIYLLGLG